MLSGSGRNGDNMYTKFQLSILEDLYLQYEDMEEAFARFILIYGVNA